MNRIIQSLTLFPYSLPHSPPSLLPPFPLLSYPLPPFPHSFFLFFLFILPPFLLCIAPTHPSLLVQNKINFLSPLPNPSPSSSIYFIYFSFLIFIIYFFYFMKGRGEGGKGEREVEENGFYLLILFNYSLLPIPSTQVPFPPFTNNKKKKKKKKKSLQKLHNTKK